MIPAGYVDQTLEALLEHLHAGDTVIDGGNSDYRDDLRRSRELAERGIHYVDMGTSGGVFGLERGYCLMIGGEPSAVRAPRPVLRGACARPRRRAAHAGAREARARRPRATCTAAPAAPGTS